MKEIHVVAAVVRRGEEICIAKRPDHVHQGGLWEFPGGKVDAGESAYEALVRELKEELAIEVRSAASFLEVRHNYPDKSVFLDIWETEDFAGEPIGNEGQPVEWVSLDVLNDYPFPEANRPIVEKLLAVNVSS